MRTIFFLASKVVNQFSYYLVSLNYHLFKVVRHIEMPKAAPKKSICHLKKTSDDIEMK